MRNTGFNRHLFACFTLFILMRIVEEMKLQGEQAKFDQGT